MKSLSIFAMPKIGRIDSTKDVSVIAMDAECRAGVSDRADVGVRVASGAGIIVNYKRLLTDPKSTGTQMAVMSGAGFVNMGSHAHFELTLLASAHEAPSVRNDTTLTPSFVPYGGLRIMQVAPIQEDAVHDQPTVGAFFGARLGRRDFGIVFVPAVSIHGSRLIDEIGDLIGLSGIFHGSPRCRAAEGPGSTGGLIPAMIEGAARQSRDSTRFSGPPPVILTPNSNCSSLARPCRSALGRPTQARPTVSRRGAVSLPNASQPRSMHGSPPPVRMRRFSGEDD